MSLLCALNMSWQDHVLQIDFSIKVSGEIVPCVIWKANASPEPRTLIALGHGGSQYEKAPSFCDIVGCFFPSIT